MARLHTSFVLGYHGCDRAVGENVLLGKTGLARSDKDYDWLGPGVYFWEADPQRALEWAREKKGRGALKHPYVIGAVIDLGNCLDLISRENISLLAQAYDSFEGMFKKGHLDKLPENTKTKDKVLRYLDCAVIKHLHTMAEESDEMEAFDTVRGLFSEGEDAFRGSGFKAKTHIQIAVCNDRSLKGFFRVPDFEGIEKCLPRA